jgi:hypothetical protein
VSGLAHQSSKKARNFIFRLLWEFTGQSLVSCFFVLSPPRRTVLVLLLVLEFLTRLGANTIFKAFESVSRRKLTAGVSQAPSVPPRATIAHAIKSYLLMPRRFLCILRELWARFAHQSTSGYLAAKSPLKSLVLVDQSGVSVHNATGNSRSEVKTSRSFRFAAGLPIVATRRSVLPNLHRFLNPRQLKADLGFQGWQMEAE